VFTIEPDRVLAGSLAVGASFALVQERLFDSSKPYFAPGARTLVFAKPLPRYQIYRDVLPEGSYLQWTERLDSSVDVASLGDPALVEPVAAYLAVRDDPEALARYLGGLTTSPTARLRMGALAAIEARPELAPLLDATALEPLAAFLADQRIPLASRGDTLVRLARAGAVGIGAIAEEVAGRRGPLLPAAVDALVTIDRLPSEDRLFVYARGDDEALRLAAVRGLVKVDTPAALDRVAAMIADDASSAVRQGAIGALGWSKGARVVAILARALRGDDLRDAVAAAEALGHEGSDGAVAALEGAFLERTDDVRVAAAFALKQSGSRRGYDFLVTQKRNNPDHDIQRVCKLALGESLHEH
jgi:HEAT repeat protein